MRLARFGAQGGSRSTTDWHCFKAVLCRELEGRRPGVVIPTTFPIPFPGIVHSGLYGIALTDEKSKQKQLKILGLQTILSPNENQWVLL